MNKIAIKNNLFRTEVQLINTYTASIYLRLT